MSNASRVKTGVIGVGNMGSKHVENILAGKIPEMELAAIADVDPKRLEWAARNTPETVKKFSLAAELFKSGCCDAVIIATPHYFHPPLVMEAIRNGMHVMCEKPAGVYTKAVREMNEFAEKHDRVFGMMFNQRTNHVYRKMHELVHGGELGEIRRINWIITDWYRTQSYYDSGNWRATWEGEGGGVLLNQCPHNLDLWQWICGMPDTVRSFCHYGQWHDIEVEDDVTTYMEYKNGASGVFITTTGDAPGTNRFEITLNKGKLVCENDTLKLYELEKGLKEHCATATLGFSRPQGKWVELTTDGMNEQHVGVLKAFAGKILHDTPLAAEGYEGINGLTLSNAMHLSSWTNSAVTFPLDEDLFLEELNKRRKASRLKKGEAVHFDTEGTY